MLSTAIIWGVMQKLQTKWQICHHSLTHSSFNSIVICTICSFQDLTLKMQNQTLAQKSIFYQWIILYASSNSNLKITQTFIQIIWFCTKINFHLSVSSRMRSISISPQDPQHGCSHFVEIDLDILRQNKLPILSNMPC